MGKRARSSGSGQEGEQQGRFSEDVNSIKYRLNRRLRELQIATPLQLQPYVTQLEKMLNESEAKPNLMHQFLHEMVADNVVKLIDEINKTNHYEYKIVYVTKKVFAEIHHMLSDLRAKCDELESFVRLLSEYMLRLSFPEDRGVISWRSVMRTLSNAAVVAGQVKAQQEAQQMIQNVQQQANQAIQQAQQQALQAQGNMQL